MKKLLLLFIVLNISQSVYSMDIFKAIANRWGWGQPMEDGEGLEAGPSGLPVVMGDVTFVDGNAGPHSMYEVSGGREFQEGVPGDDNSDVEMDDLTLEKFRNMSEEERDMMEANIDRMIGRTQGAQQTVAKRLAPQAPTRSGLPKVKISVSDSEFKAGLQDMIVSGASVQETLMLKIHFNQMRAEEGQRRAAMASNLFARKSFCLQGVLFLYTSGTVGIGLAALALNETGYTVAELLAAAAENLTIG